MHRHRGRREDGGRDPAGPHRVRPRRRLPATTPRRRSSRDPGASRRASRGHRAELATRWQHDDPTLQIVDVRNPGEVADGAIPGARHIPLAPAADRLGELDRRPADGRATAPAATAPASRPRCCARARLHRRVATCSAATARGQRSRNRSGDDQVAADQRCVERAVDRVGSRLLARSSARQTITARPKARTPWPRRRGGPAACASRGPCGAGPSAATGTSPPAGWR